MPFKTSLPKNYLGCPQIASELIDNKFLAFKTPLSNLYDHKVQGEFFHVSSVFEYAKRKGFKLGLWVCLTDTDRYYDGEEVTANGCKFIHFYCNSPNHTLPPKPIQEDFKRTCHTYSTNHPDDVIGVHCTHGFNRTGFFIISYLVEMLNWDLEAAVAEFTRIRPPGIFREKLLLGLYRKYKPNVTPELPPIPDWGKKQVKDTDQETMNGRTINRSTMSRLKASNLSFKAQNSSKLHNSGYRLEPDHKWEWNSTC